MTTASVLAARAAEVRGRQGRGETRTAARERAEPGRGPSRPKETSFPGVFKQKTETKNQREEWRRLEFSSVRLEPRLPPRKRSPRVGPGSCTVLIPSRYRFPIVVQIYLSGGGGRPRCGARATFAGEGAGSQFPQVRV